MKAASVLLVAALLTTSCAGTIEPAEPNSERVDAVPLAANVDSASEAPMSSVVTTTPPTVTSTTLQSPPTTTPKQVPDTATVALQPRRWVSRPLEPQIAVTFVDEGWTAIDYGCDGLLDYATFRHYPDFATTAALYVGPIHQDCPFVELVADLPTIDSTPVQVEIGVDDWYALLYEESLPDWSYLGVRLGPNSRGLGHLYLIEGDERNYFVFITAPTELFEEFAAMARTVLESLELDVGP